MRSSKAKIEGEYKNSLVLSLSRETRTNVYACFCAAPQSSS